MSDDDWGDGPADKVTASLGGMSMGDDGWGGSSGGGFERSDGGYQGGRGGGRGGRGGGAGGGSKPGDWDCVCGQSNFATRHQCFKCQEPKPGGGGDSFGGGVGRERRAGDWDCSCGANNFSNRSECFKCHEAKPEGAGDSFGGGGGNARERRAGDWDCSCGANNFSNRSECFKCHEAKPEGAGDSGGGDRGGRESKPGEWKCPCGTSNFARRTECFKCNDPKPEGAETEGGDGEERPKPYVPPVELEGEEAFSERKELYEGSGINFSKYEDIKYELSGDAKVPSYTSFANMNLRDLVMQNIQKVGYKVPTPIQKHATPQLMNGLDVMACAQTGSGKTAAFLLPIINTLLVGQSDLDTSARPVKPEALILAPTRELAIQIHKEARLYSQDSILKTVVCYGGTALFVQRNQLQGGCNILVATPGRLKQFVNENYVSLEKVQFFILDEADRMLDMGFMGDVQELVDKMPSAEERCSGMFSATFPVGVQKAAAAFLKKDYIFVVIGIVGGACADVVQEFLQVERAEKRGKLMDILRDSPEEDKILIFCNAKKGADFLAASLSSQGISTTSIHGDRLQSQRELALREFIQGKKKVLVATAVAARGLDIPKVSTVINYDLPNDVDEYVHRIGRTGRLGHTGRAISFYEEGQDAGMAAQLKGILEGAGQQVPDFFNSESGYYGGSTNGFSSTDHRDGVAKHAPNPVEKDDDDWD